MTPQNVSTFTFYDLETFGTDPRRDRICQFAAVRTDTDLNILEEMVCYCRPPRDYLPSLEAVEVTGITPAFASQSGDNENIFMGKVLGFLTRPGNCVLGYNSVKFDDEFLRNAAFRNFFPPYEYNTFSGSSRWDVYPLIRLCCALCPEGINWPKAQDEDGERYSLKLADLTAANGLEHDNAHDAMSDVRATIALLRLVFQKQPKMFSYVFRRRTRRALLESLTDPLTGELLTSPLLTVHSRFGPDHLFTGAVLPVMMDPQKRYVYCWDLTRTEEEYQDLPSLEELDCQAVTMSDLGIVKIKLASCPVLVPLNALLPEGRRERVDLDPEAIKKLEEYFRQDDLKRNYLEGCVEKFEKEYSSTEAAATQDPEFGLYSMPFAGPEAAALQNLRLQIRQAEQRDPYTLKDIVCPDPATAELLFRFRARNYEQLLSADEQQRWGERITAYSREHAGSFLTELNDMCMKYEKDPAMMNLLKETAVFYGITG